MLRIKPLVCNEKMWRVEPIRRSPKSTSLDARPTRHLDDREAAAAEQLKRFPMLRRHLLIDQERHSFKFQRPLRAQKLLYALDHPMAEGHRVDTHQRPCVIELDDGRRALVDDRANFLAITTEDQ